MQYAITAFDGEDPDALTRRLAARPAHLARVKLAKDAGQIIAGGAILNDGGQMIGSTIYVEFESRQALDQWISEDPYIKGQVWKEITIHPIKLAARD